VFKTSRGLKTQLFSLTWRECFIIIYLCLLGKERESECQNGAYEFLIEDSEIFTSACHMCKSVVDGFYGATVQA
jgi:hypothetical protein